jgi:ribosome-associated toxin RatA of RatAB toxin-antitoxin module
MKSRVAAVLLGLALAPPCLSADWALSEAQLSHLKTGAIVAEGDVATDRAAVDVRAAVQVSATPEEVFVALTDCERALRFVPHLKRCAVLDTAADGSWQEVEQHVDYGWLAPRAHYVFRAEYKRYSAIRFSHLRGDFHENRGVWHFQPIDGGRATVVTYQARVAPAFYVPKWMMRSMLRRDLPELMRGLRTSAEAGRARPATSAKTPPGS